MAARLVQLMHLDRADVLTVDADYRNLKDDELIRAGASKSNLAKVRKSLAAGGCFYCDPQVKQFLVGYSVLQESFYFRQVALPIVDDAVVTRLKDGPVG